MVLQTDSNKSIQPPVIDSDLPCRQCGYNLRGLLSSGACPECGHAVAESARRNLLRDSDPNYARALGAGVIVTIVGLGLSAFAGAVMPPTIVVEYLEDPSWRALAILTIVLAIIVMSIGLWIVTAVDPAVFEDRRHERLRKIVRFLVVVGTLTQLIGIAIAFGSSDGPMSLDVSERLIISALVLINAGALIAAVFAIFRYLQMLSYRIPDPVLARRFTLLTWSFGIPYSLIIIANAGVGLLASSGWTAVLSAHVESILFFNTVVWAMTVLAGLFYIAALWRLRRGTFAPPLPAPPNI